jgi:hypothetical protein
MKSKTVLMSLVFLIAIAGALISQAPKNVTSAFGYDTQSPANCVSGTLNFTDCAVNNTGAMCTVTIGANTPQAYNVQNNQFSCAQPLQRLH